MIFLAVLLAFLAGALGMFSLVTLQQCIHDWRSDAWLSVGVLFGAVVLACYA
jgi:uncharacterized membrane protein